MALGIQKNKDESKYKLKIAGNVSSNKNYTAPTDNICIR